MIEQGTGGRMALLASVSGIYGAPIQGAYGAAKAGAMDLARTMAQEWDVTASESTRWLPTFPHGGITMSLKETP